jgi:signal peptidase II
MKWFWLSGVIVVLDQVSKQVAVNELGLHQPVQIAPLINFTLTYNSGAAFSFLSNAGGWQRWLFVGLSSAVSIGLVVWLVRTPVEKRWLPTSLALILGGALGNLWDRIAIGRVIDFVDVYYGSWHWPAFNVADSAICIGAVLLLISSFRDSDEGNSSLIRGTQDD